MKFYECIVQGLDKPLLADEELLEKVKDTLVILSQKEVSEEYYDNAILGAKKVQTPQQALASILNDMSHRPYGGILIGVFALTIDPRSKTLKIDFIKALKQLKKATKEIERRKSPLKYINKYFGKLKESQIQRFSRKTLRLYYDLYLSALITSIIFARNVNLDDMIINLDEEIDRVLEELLNA